MTTNAKLYIKLDKALTAANNGIEKFSGRNFNGNKVSEWTDKANKAIQAMNAIELSNEDQEDIDSYFSC